jgi:pyruvate ferredoxin oxidoreductase alpha subunit
MREQIEGSRAIAETAARCRPQVVPAYPITPQTHIVEAVGAMIKTGRLAPAEFITVESEFGAMSAAIGASAAGARTYTATASQGLLYMAEALYNAAGLGLPIVMTVANRAIGAPINIWNDHSDAMSQRDCGWIQLYAEDNQSAVGLHVIAFRLAEELSVPVMVCVDGFVLTHAFEPIELPDPSIVDAYLPPYRPRQLLDPDEPVTIGAMVGPEAFTEVRYLAQHQLNQAIRRFRELSDEYRDAAGQELRSVSSYRCDGAQVIIVALGSVLGTIKDAVDELLDSGAGKFGVVGLGLYRPFPAADVRSALAGADQVIVLERAFAPGAGGVVTADIRAALAGLPVRINTVVAGLGGRAVTKSSVRAMLERARADDLPDFSFLDLRHDLVDAELTRRADTHAAGPTAQNLLRATGAPGTRIG